MSFSVYTRMRLLIFCLFSISCHTDIDISAGDPDSYASEIPVTVSEAKATVHGPGMEVFSENLRIQLEIPPAACGATEFSKVTRFYKTALLQDSIALAHADYYFYMNYNAAILNWEEEYFGPDGRYTRLVLKTKKDLERFWNMPGEIDLHGQHNETLSDREKLIRLHMYLIADIEDEEELFPLVDELMRLNALSPNLPESPLFAADAFSTFNNVIVIGDGLVQLFVETGLDPKIVWTGILSHEWAHQLQLKHLQEWYAPGNFESAAERRRFLELEADFLSAYYMTHKRGASYNWKRATEFFKLFFESGDCSFEFELHHGTPQQREAAARAGYELAASAQKQGHILSIEELHSYFLNLVSEITD